MKLSKKFIIIYFICISLVTALMYIPHASYLADNSPEEATKSIQQRINYSEAESLKILDLFNKDLLQTYHNDSVLFMVSKNDTPIYWNKQTTLYSQDVLKFQNSNYYGNRFLLHKDTLFYFKHIDVDNYRISIIQNIGANDDNFTLFSYDSDEEYKKFPFNVKLQLEESPYPILSSSDTPLYLEFESFKYKPNSIITILFHIVSISLIIVISKVVKQLYRHFNKYIIWIIYSFLTLYMMYIIFTKSIQIFNINNTHSFSTTVYTLDDISISIGQLLYISVLNLCLAVSYFNNVSLHKVANLRNKILKVICFITITLVYFFITFPLIVFSIKENQHLFSYYNFSKVNVYSLLALGNVILNVLSIVVLSYIIISPKKLVRKGMITQLSKALIHIIFTVYFITQFKELDISYYQYAFVTLLYFTFIAYTLPNFIKNTHQENPYSFKFTSINGFLWCLITCLWITNLIFISNYQREKLLRKEIAYSLNIEKDHVAEFKLQKTLDEVIAENDSNKLDTIKILRSATTLGRLYFDNIYLTAVSIEANPSLVDTSIINIEEYSESSNTTSSLNSQIDINKNIYTIQYSWEQNNRPIFLLFEFVIPEYYVHTKLSKYNEDSNYSLFYSVAIFYKEILRTISGNDEDINLFEKNLQKTGFNESLNHSYYTQQNSDGQIVVIKYNRYVLIQFLSIFSYCLIAIFTICVVVTIIINQKRISINIDFKDKINVGIISIVSLTFILLSIISINYLKSEFNKQEFKRIKNEKSRFQSYTYNIINQYNSEITPIDMPLTEVTKIFPINNIFSQKPSLRIFSLTGLNYENGIIQILDPEILYALKKYLIEFNASKNNKTPLPYTVFYEDKEYAYHFVKINDNIKGIFQFKIPDNDFEEEYSLDNIITILINIYVLLFILSITVTLVIVNNLTKGIQKLIGQIRNFSLTKNTPIKYDHNDEISLLVKEYNNLLKNVEIMAANLANSERESAWREAAKQVAHEINNPITPIKLNIQYLIKEVENNKDITELFLRVSKSIVQEIDKLSNIAQSFSNYGTMPDPLLEKIDIIQHIRSVCTILYVDLNIQLIFDFPNEPVYVFADSKFLNIAFMNLIKNAFQSLENRPQPHLKIQISHNNDTVVIRIQDNGIGMTNDTLNKIFVPNFTTKSSGKGIGLSTTKSMINSMNGTIYVTSQEGVGTTFSVKFPTIE